MIGIRAVFVSVFSSVVAVAPPPVAQACPDGEIVDLATVWSEMRATEPGYRIAEEAAAAAEARRSAVRREWLPGVSAEGIENWGQRLSPSEERNLGVGPRGELRVLGSWTILDTSRGWRTSEEALRRSEATLAGDAFDLVFRADVARLFVEAATAEAAADARREQRAALEELAVPVQRRLEEGVEARWEGHLLDEALARSERLLAEAEQEEAGARAELSALLGRCVRPAPLALLGDAWEPAGMEELDEGSPDVARLHRLADAREAAAGAEAARDRLQLQIVGSTGPTRSRAFDDPYRMEYLVGFTGRWTPDLARIRHRRSEAESADARALRSEAESRRHALARELDRLAAELARADERGRRLDAEVERTERRLDAALLRWREGVGHWTDVIQAHEQAHEARQLRLELEREVAHAWIREGEVRGDLSRVPGRLGQEEVR